MLQVHDSTIRSQPSKIKTISTPASIAAQLASLILLVLRTNNAVVVTVGLSETVETPKDKLVG